MFQVVFEMFWWPWVLHWVNGFKGLLLTLEQLLAAESPLKMMKNAFHFILKLIRYLHFCPAFLSKYTKLKKSVGWTIDKFRLNNSLVIKATILRFAYRKIDVQRRMFSNFWDFCCSYHQKMTLWTLLSEGRDEKGGFVETNSSEYTISKSKMQGIFEPGFASHRIK